MDIADIVQFYTEIGRSVFRSYAQFGRPFLDFLHVIFDKLFYVFLFLAVIVSTAYFVMSLFIMFKNPKQKEKRFQKEKAPFVTIQIPTYNELAALRCAKKCLAFDYPKGKYEIIIGDDSNNPEVSQKIDEFAAQHSQVKVTRRGSNKGYKAGNLNHMLTRSKGSILVLFDSDFAPEKDFLRRIVNPFIDDPEIAGVQARWKFMEKNKNLVSILGSTIMSVFHRVCLPFINKRSEISFLCGSAEAVRKKDLIESGNWQTGSLTEDIEFSLRLHKKGKKIVYLDELECAGEVPHKAKDLYKQQMRWAYGVITAFREHFRSLMTSTKVTLKQKLHITFFCSGYLFSFVLLMLFATGFLSFVTHPPAPVDFARFFSEMGRNILLTSGIIITSIFALAKDHNLRKFLAMVGASFSVGLIVTYYVNVGIIKVIFNRPMRWYMLSKKGNLEA
ncbi:glycosyltransferase [Candidatus Woesearchaeota archaeon]|nr:glycosyltransferase [Candidatus Woesearchaeota archaeon]